MQSVIIICCDLLSELKNSYVRMTFDVVCHSEKQHHKVLLCWSLLSLWCDLEQPLWESWWLWLWYLQCWGLLPWSAMSVSVLVMVSRSWSGAMHGAGILSMTMGRCGLRVISSVGSLPLYDNMPHIWSNVHLDNDVLCDLTLDIGNIYLPYEILHWLWMKVTK